jgi:hypothetical protein
MQPWSTAGMLALARKQWSWRATRRGVSGPGDGPAQFQCQQVCGSWCVLACVYVRVARLAGVPRAPFTGVMGSSLGWQPLKDGTGCVPPSALHALLPHRRGCFPLPVAVHIALALFALRTSSGPQYQSAGGPHARGQLRVPPRVSLELRDHQAASKQTMACRTRLSAYGARRHSCTRTTPRQGDRGQAGASAWKHLMQHFVQSCFCRWTGFWGG